MRDSWRTRCHPVIQAPVRHRLCTTQGCGTRSLLTPLLIWQLSCTQEVLLPQMLFGLKPFATLLMCSCVCGGASEHDEDVCEQLYCNHSGVLTFSLSLLKGFGRH